MATINYAHTRVNAFPYPADVYTWPGMVGAADSCTPLQCPQMRDKSIQVSGTAGSATVALHGSNNGTDYAVLSDPAGNALTGLTAGIYQVGQITQYVKPVPTGTLGVLAVTLVGAYGRV